MSRMKKKNSWKIKTRILLYLLSRTCLQKSSHLFQFVFILARLYGFYEFYGGTSEIMFVTTTTCLQTTNLFTAYIQQHIFRYFMYTSVIAYFRTFQCSFYQFLMRKCIYIYTYIFMVHELMSPYYEFHANRMQILKCKFNLHIL